MRKFLLLLLSVVCLACVSYRKPPARGEEPRIRVLLLENEESLTFSSPASYSLKMQNSTKKEIAFRQWTIRKQSEGVEMVDRKAKRRISHVHLPLVVEPREIFFLNGSPYRGKLIVKRNARGFLAINEVPLEEYLKGVVPCEMGSGAPFEALKAQAVAARTYALANLAKHADEGYDLASTVSDQVYRGVNAEAASTDRAVAETQGLVLLYGGKPIDAKYHSTCGGRTADMTEVSSRVRMPYLRSVDDRGGSFFGRKRPFCAASPHFTWTRVWSMAEFDELVDKSLRSLLGVHDPGRTRRVKVRKTRSGRVKEFTVITDRNSYKVYGDQVRNFLGELPSTKFDIIMKRDIVRLEGHGYGHGLGMCQWGAMGMGQQGYDFKRILSHYYRGTRLRKLY